MLSFPRGTKMFQFPRSTSTTYGFSRRLHSMTCARLPHSGISGSTPVSGSPKLFAACYALHRLLAPRNPPQALLRLTKKYFLSYFKRYSIVKERWPPLRAFSKPYLLFCIQTQIGGGERVRTDDLLRARQALSQLSYTPITAAMTLPSRFGAN